MDNRPSHQRIFKWAGLVLVGALSAGAALDALGNSISLISLPAAVYSTAVIVPVWLLTELTAAFVGITWSAASGSRVILRSLGPRVRLGIVGTLALLWLPQLGRLLPTDVRIPNLQVELRNQTSSELNIATRGEFVLWLPSALYDGSPRIGGKATIVPLNSAAGVGGNFTVAPGQSVRCSVTFLNPRRFIDMLEGEEADGSVVIQTSQGSRISPNFAFSATVIGKKYLDWPIEDR